jgi:hypothetical protein
MKYNSLLVSAALTILSLNACKKSEPPPLVSTSSMSYKVNGVVANAESTYAVGAAAGNFTIYGINASQTVVISMRTMEVGSYDMQDFTARLETTSSIYIPNYSYYGNPRTLKITSLTKDRVKGTFEFTINDTTDKVSKTVTDGVFDCEIR